MSYISCVDLAHLQKFVISYSSNFIRGLKNLMEVRIEDPIGYVVDKFNILAQFKFQRGWESTAKEIANPFFFFLSGDMFESVVNYNKFVN